MALADKLGNGIASHQFSAAIFLWADGTINRQSVVDKFGLEAADEAQLDQLKAVYDAKSTGLLKMAYAMRVEKVLMLLESSLITKSQAKTFLELT